VCLAAATATAAAVRVLTRSSMTASLALLCEYVKIQAELDIMEKLVSIEKIVIASTSVIMIVVLL